MVHTSTLKLKSITQKHVQYMQILHHDPFSNSDKYTRYASSEQQGVSPSEVLLLDAFKQFHNFEDYDSMLEYFETYSSLDLCAPPPSRRRTRYPRAHFHNVIFLHCFWKTLYNYLLLWNAHEGTSCACAKGGGAEIQWRTRPWTFANTLEGKITYGWSATRFTPFK